MTMVSSIVRPLSQAATDIFDSDDDNNGENEDDIVKNKQSIAGDVGSAPDIDPPDGDFEHCSVSNDEEGTGRYYLHGNPCDESRRSSSPPPV